MGLRPLYISFNGGEVSTELFGRMDDAKYKGGCRALRNAIAKPQGPAENRAGFEFVIEVKDSARATRLIPFAYSTTQTMVLEMGHQYFRFHTNGATLLAGSPAAYNGGTAYVPGDLVSSAGTNYYCIANTTGNAPPNATYWYAMPASGIFEIPSPYDEADLFHIRYEQSIDVITLTHPSYQQRELSRLGATNWVLTTIDFDEITVSSTVYATSSGHGTDYRYKYKLTKVYEDGTESAASEAALHSPNPSITNITNAIIATITTAVTHNLRVGDRVYISGVTGMTGVNNKYYDVNSVPTTTTLTLYELDGSYLDTTASGAYVANGTVMKTFCINDLTTPGAYNRIDMPAYGGTIASWNIYKEVGGIYGFIGNTEGRFFVDDNIEADLSITPPIYDVILDSADNYPAVNTYFEQRRVFAGSNNKPQTIWMSRTAKQNEMTYHLPIKDDDRLSFTISSRDVNTIQHLVPLDNLIVLTQSAEWVAGSINSDAMTPTSFSVKPKTYVGSSHIRPVTVNENVLYVSARGCHIQELTKSEGDGLLNRDISIRSTHLFDGYSIVDSAYSKTPVPMFWAISSSGDLLSMTYVPEQEVRAWQHHDTVNGTFESCAVVAEGDEDYLYCVIARTIDGNNVRYIERMHSRRFSTIDECFFVDCGLTYDSTPATTISGLDHLEGQTVAILADGTVHPQQVVTGGEITLEQEASVVHIGLPITADIEPLPPVLNIDSSGGMGKKININKINIRLYRSSGIFVGPDTDRLTQYKQRTTEPPGSPPSLKSGIISIVPTPSWGEDGAFVIRQSDPLPLTISSISLDVTTGG